MSFLNLLWQRLRDPGVRDHILRILSLGLISVAVGACAVLVLAFILELHLLLVVFSGVLSVSGALFLFVRLWPRDMPGFHPEVENPGNKSHPKPKPPSPEEYRRQREQAQRMIRDKAAPALAKAIRGFLMQDEVQKKQAWQEKRQQKPG